MEEFDPRLSLPRPPWIRQSKEADILPGDKSEEKYEIEPGDYGDNTHHVFQYSFLDPKSEVMVGMHQGLVNSVSGKYLCCRRIGGEGYRKCDAEADGNSPIMGCFDKRLQHRKPRNLGWIKVRSIQKHGISSSHTGPVVHTIVLELSWGFVVPQAMKSTSPRRQYYEQLNKSTLFSTTPSNYAHRNCLHRYTPCKITSPSAQNSKYTKTRPKETYGGDLRRGDVQGIVLKGTRCVHIPYLFQ